MPSDIFNPRNKYGDGITLDQFECKMHEGHVFDMFAEKLDLAYSSTYNILFTPGTKDVIIVFDVSVTGGRTIVALYENPTCSGGSAITCYNRARNSSNTCEMTIVENPTVTTTGTNLIATRQIFGSTSAQGRSSTSIGETAQRVFKKNTEYLMKFTANAASMMFACSGMFLEE